MEIDAALAATLRLWRRTAHVYGHSDCLLSIADYGRLLTGADIGLPWRGTYSTEAEAVEIVRKAGGAASLLGGALTRAGMVPVDTPERGDALVVQVLNLEAGALHLGQRVAMRLPRGVTEIRADLVDILGAWRCPQ